jgi:hypothetical protein
MRIGLLAGSAVILGLWAGAALAQDADDAAACRQAFGGGANYRACLTYRSEARSGDDFTAAIGRAGLMRLQQRAFDDARRQEESPDFSAYGVAAPSHQRPAPPAGCVILGDGLGGGIVDCN